MKPVVFAGAVILVWSAPPIAAAIVYNSGPFSAGQGSTRSDFDIVPAALPQATRQLANEFTLANSATITGLHWWGQYVDQNTPGADNFTVRIFSTLNGKPAVNPLYQFILGSPGRSNTGVVAFGADIYAYSADFSTPVSLPGGFAYWLSVVNNTADDPDDSWNWMRAGEPGYTGSVKTYWRASDGVAWSTDSETSAYELRGEFIPEPTAWTLLLSGGLPLALTMRNRNYR